MISQNKYLLQAWYYTATTQQEKEVLHALHILSLLEKYKHAVKWVHRDVQFNFLTQTQNGVKLEIWLSQLKYSLWESQLKKGKSRNRI